MRLEQGQIWEKGEDFILIVVWERHFIEYKTMQDLETREGTSNRVTKKEFCKLLKGATLQVPVKEAKEEPTK